MRFLFPLLLLSLAACDPDAPAVDAGTDAGPPFDAGRPILPDPPAAEPGLHDVALIETRRVVPSDGLPAETPHMHSNNNLDVVEHEGRVYLAWRTAPDHYAGPDTVIHVVSSADEVTWDFEASFEMGTDLREPRLLSLGTSLFLYVSVLGEDSLAFEPMGVVVTERAADGTWSALEDVPGLAGYIAWRTRVERGTPYMTAYLGRRAHLPLRRRAAQRRSPHHHRRARLAAGRSLAAHRLHGRRLGDRLRARRRRGRSTGSSATSPATRTAGAPWCARRPPATWRIGPAASIRRSTTAR